MPIEGGHSFEATGSLTTSLHHETISTSMLETVKSAQMDDVNNEAMALLAQNEDNQDNLQDTVEILAGVIRQTAGENVKRPPASERCKNAKKVDQVQKNVKVEDATKDAANGYAQKSRGELQAAMLLRVRQQLDEGKGGGKEAVELLKKELKDPNLIDEALSFLEETSTDPKVRESIAEARDEHFKANEGEIHKGQVFSAIARKMHDKGAGTASELHQKANDMVELDAFEAFKAVKKKHPTYEAMQAELRTLMGTMGEMTKYPEIEPAQLVQLMKGIRTVQAVTGVFNHFFKDKNGMAAEFAKVDKPTSPFAAAAA